jgi:hypothetical protein
LRYGLLRRGVSRNLAAPNPPQGVSFCFFSLFLFFSFFFLGGVLPYSPNDLRAHFGQIPRYIGQKTRLHRAKNTSTSGKFHVFFSGKLTHCPIWAKKPIKQPVKNVSAFFTGLTTLTNGGQNGYAATNFAG